MKTKAFNIVIVALLLLVLLCNIIIIIKINNLDTSTNVTPALDNSSINNDDTNDDNGLIELTKENVDNYISIRTSHTLTGSKYYNLLGTNDTFANKLDFQCNVRGKYNDFEYENVTLTVKVKIKTTGYSRSEFSDYSKDRSELTPYQNDYEYEYTFRLLEDGSTEDIAHDYIDFGDLHISEERVFMHYEVTAVTGQVQQRFQ